MYRYKIEELKSWKTKKNRKPLIIKGARQVGKTWLMKEFGKQEYTQTLYVNFEKDSSLRNLFSGTIDIKQILSGLQIITGFKAVPNDTLIILDEIQVVPEALTYLKYFYEDAPDYHIIAAGSLLGVSMHSSVSYPVGKVDLMNLYPLTFHEYLIASGNGSLVDIIKDKNTPLIKSLKEKAVLLLRQYYFVGGMPEIVQNFLTENDYHEARDIQRTLLNNYEQDFSKYAPVELLPRIRMVWNSVPAQLAKENRKFIYGLLKKGARAKEFELAIQWLEDSGLIYKLHRVTKPGIPLKSYEDFTAFKIFMVDTGLLGCMANLDIKSLVEGNRLFSEFKGAISEQFVMQQLLSYEDISLFYWSAEGAKSEVDFVFQKDNEIYPLEVKAEENLKSKSLQTFARKYNPPVSYRTSLSDYREQDWMINIPLFAIDMIFNQ